MRNIRKIGENLLSLVLASQYKVVQTTNNFFGPNYYRRAHTTRVYQFELSSRMQNQSKEVLMKKVMI